MFKINNNNFLILNKYKIFIIEIDNLLENVPRKDFFFKDKIKEISESLLESILRANYEEDKNSLIKEQINIKSLIATLDFMLERLWLKKYISEKNLMKIGNELIEINKMSSTWLKGLIESAS